MSRTLFERLQGKFGSTASAMLTMQYRMNTAIMQWPSHELYQDLLTAHPSVATHTLQGLQASLHIAYKVCVMSGLPYDAPFSISFAVCLALMHMWHPHGLHRQFYKCQTCYAAVSGHCRRPMEKSVQGLALMNEPTHVCLSYMC